MEEKKKVGLSSIEWILSIMGIILLLLVIVLPPVFRVVFKEEVQEENNNNSNIQENLNTEEKTTIDDTSYTKITCTKQESTSNYIETVNVVLAHQNNLLKILTTTSVKTYLLDTKESENLFAEAKLACSNISDQYYQVTGYSHSCNTSVDAVHVTQKYDLNNFQSTLVNNQDGTTTQLQTAYSLDQNVEDIKMSLVNDGYTCQ